MKIKKCILPMFLLFSLFGCDGINFSKGSSSAFISSSSNHITPVVPSSTSTNHISNSSSDVTSESSSDVTSESSKNTSSSNSSSSEQNIVSSSSSKDKVSSVVSTSKPPLSSSSSVEQIDQMEVEYQEFFDINTRVEITIKMSKSELKKLNNDYSQYKYNGGKSPLSRSADVEIKFGDKVYNFDQVGIKMKGNTSRTQFLDKDGEINKLIHYKLDFADTFGDEYYDGSTYPLTSSKSERKDRRFLGMEKIDLKWNRNFDSTHIKQWYAYQTFAAFGVLSNKMNLGKINLQIDNNVPKTIGVYEIYEVIDKKFFERRLPQEEVGGDLYKCCYTAMGPANLTVNNLDKTIGVEDEVSSYFPMYDLKTNKKTSDHSLLKNMIQYLNSNNVTKDGLAQYVNMDHYLMEEAVAYVLGNPDDFRNNYNNYYLYFGKTSQKCYLIPYDWDHCLGVTRGWNPTGNGLTQVKHNSNWAQGANSSQANPLIKYTLGRENVVIKDYNNIFTNNIKEIFKSKWTNPNLFNEYYNIAKSHYQNDCFPEFSKASSIGITFDNRDNAGDNMSFNQYMSKKRQFFYSTIGEQDPGYATY